MFQNLFRATALAVLASLVTFTQALPQPTTLQRRAPLDPSDHFYSAHITVLDQNYFSSEVENSDVPVVITFYAHWCGNSKRFAPTWQAVAAKYADPANQGNSESSLSQVNFYQYDCALNDDHRDFCAEKDTGGYPTPFMYKRGVGRVEIEEYESEDGLTKSIENFVAAHR
ncbi:Thioredoxin domain-containing protein 5 [Dimargaris cristalligena]|uniref:Thioredoxin-like protein n=1 Tax=Dimargaris cristalligena TaxID=215637 RepID=A0A4P9ZQD4_9FUNG|nr:Thioredoxin domain-containing protein 5 [Dimargaris cristalligena]RKP35495.1 thioredoxin-like protein [Dimargaris cristalligena]|eukprot:RKP35495.1 thioredoxin-like protein [Dimargaris cristalligena]